MKLTKDFSCKLQTFRQAFEIRQKIYDAAAAQGLRISAEIDDTSRIYVKILNLVKILKK
jgi:hypothetical protein